MMNLSLMKNFPLTKKFHSTSKDNQICKSRKTALATNKDGFILDTIRYKTDIIQPTRVLYHFKPRTAIGVFFILFFKERNDIMAKAKKLPSGQWRTLVYDYTDSNGKRHYESFTADSKKESEYLAAEFALNKKSKAKNDMTFKEARNKYIESKSNVLSPSTIYGYRKMGINYKLLDDIKLSKVNQEHIQMWVNDFALTRSPKTVRNAYGLASAILKTYKPNLELNITLPQKIAPTYYVPSDADIKAIINYLSKNDIEMLKAVYLAAFGTLRRSEICGLDASDISGNIIHVHRALVKNENMQLEIKTTKTMSSSRYIEIPKFAIDIFPKEGRVVSLTPDAISHRFRRMLLKLGISHFRFHDLRHYSASIMHAIGVPDQYIMARGGWSSDKVLKEIYRGTIDNYQKQFTDLTNNHFNDLCNTKCNTEQNESDKN